MEVMGITTKASLGLPVSGQQFEKVTAFGISGHVQPCQQGKGNAVWRATHRSLREHCKVLNKWYAICFLIHFPFRFPKLEVEPL